MRGLPYWNSRGSWKSKTLEPKGRYKMKYTPDCNDDCTFMLEPVPGANQWPRRISCKIHGYPSEHRSKFTAGAPEPDKPNLYLTEVASPADVFERTDGHIESQY
jgi:hypothetical protein